MPHSLLVKIGYSRIGQEIVGILRKAKQDKWYEIENGVKIYLDLTNPHTWDLVQKKDPEKKIKETFLDNIKNGDTVFDVGANIGEYSIIAAKKIGSSGAVFSFEPVSETAAWLRKNLALNDQNNHTVFESAVSDTLGKMVLYKKNKSAGMGLLDPSADKRLVKSDAILVETIDNIIHTRQIGKVDMLKIDVEGHEYEVLLGCKESFHKKIIQKILCEVHRDYLKEKDISEDKIYSFLQKNGFSVNFIEEKEKTVHILAILA